MKDFTLYSILCLFVCYLTAAFSFWEYDPENWDNCARFIVAFMGLFGGAVFTVLKNEKLQIK